MESADAGSCDFSEDKSPFRLTVGSFQMDHNIPSTTNEPIGYIGINVNQTKRRGPKKKPLTKEREVRLKTRRVRANARERSRMHGLNDALESLRQHVPTFSANQRLSKIETLRLAKNYIRVLSDLLMRNESFSPLEFAHALTEGLSQNTCNLIANALQVSPRALFNEHRTSNVQSVSHNTRSTSRFINNNMDHIESDIPTTVNGSIKHGRHEVDTPSQSTGMSPNPALLKCVNLQNLFDRSDSEDVRYNKLLTQSSSSDPFPSDRLPIPVNFQQNQSFLESQMLLNEFEMDHKFHHHCVHTWNQSQE